MIYPRIGRWDVVFMVVFFIVFYSVFKLIEKPKYVLKGYSETKVVIWLHGLNMSADQAPEGNYLTMAPVCHKDDWENYDLRPIINIAKRYGLPLEIEGYSRGAFGAAYHASQNPGIFREVRCLAGYYQNFPQVVDPIKLYAGTLDKWKHSTIQYAKNLGKEVIWVKSTHNHLEFYEAVE